MGRWTRIAGFVVLGVALLALGVYGWAALTTRSTLAAEYEAHEVDFPVPFPLTADERAELDVEDEDEAEALARDRAVERGRHLLESRYACAECHGEDLGGGVMVDAFPLGSLLGPNLTGGEGGAMGDYTPADWDRIVRHGILPDGRPALMPSEDFVRMSDRELSDIIAYIRSLDPVDNEVPPSSLGPVGKILVATGQLPPSAERIDEHFAEHPLEPPPAEVSAEFGEHLAAVCVGCHGRQFEGGPIEGGDPAWGPAANLTPHPDGLEGWEYEDFRRAMLEGSRPDGTEIAEPMSLVTPMARRMTEVELEALWTYLSSLPPRETGS